MNAIEWMTEWTLNGLLPIHEASARLSGGSVVRSCEDETPTWAAMQIAYNAATNRRVSRRAEPA